MSVYWIPVAVVVLLGVAWLMFWWGHDLGYNEGRRDERESTVAGDGKAS